MICNWCRIPNISWNYWLSVLWYLVIKGTGVSRMWCLVWVFFQLVLLYLSRGSSWRNRVEIRLTTHEKIIKFLLENYDTVYKHFDTLWRVIFFVILLAPVFSSHIIIEWFSRDRWGNWIAVINSLLWSWWWKLLSLWWLALGAGQRRMMDFVRVLAYGIKIRSKRKKIN